MIPWSITIIVTIVTILIFVVVYFLEKRKK